MKKTLFLLTLILIFALAACGGNGGAPTESGTVQNDDGTYTTTVSVLGMTCQRCVTAVDRALMAVDGVNSVSINLRRNSMIVEHEAYVDIEDIRLIVILEGFRME
ncbi:MAG: heavy-metal-associated domain-containing protein [Defluviitaleaceae bacterium]|nr:heavy-metal-associated domain-containing protein [Defluviitaleaceae bacterium]